MKMEAEMLRLHKVVLGSKMLRFKGLRRTKKFQVNVRPSGVFGPFANTSLQKNVWLKSQKILAESQNFFYLPGILKVNIRPSLAHCSLR